MVQCVSFLILLHGFLVFQTEGVLDLSAESSDSRPGYRRSLYVFHMLPVQRLHGKPETVFDRKAADFLAMWASSVLGAPSVIKPPASTAGHSRLQLVPSVLRESPPTLAPPSLGSTALRSPDFTPPFQSKIPVQKGQIAELGDLGTYFSTSARFSQTPQVPTTLGLSLREGVCGTHPVSPSTTEEPRGDM